MSENEGSSEKKERRRVFGLSERQQITLAVLFLLNGYVWLCFLLLFTADSMPLNPLPTQVIAAVETAGFEFPPTWTPSPTSTPAPPTDTATMVVLGEPTRMYTPHPTPLPANVWYRRRSEVAKERDIIDLANILQGESPGVPSSAIWVGWVAKNRLMHGGYGDTIKEVSAGFFGYKEGRQPKQLYIDLARQVMESENDPTGGCLYCLSQTDIEHLGVRPEQADTVTGHGRSTWYFFKKWPGRGAPYAPRLYLTVTPPFGSNFSSSGSSGANPFYEPPEGVRPPVSSGLTTPLPR